MPTFGSSSLAKLNTCDGRLQAVFREVIKHFDCTVLTGHRGKAEQDEKFDQGLSKVRYPNSKHNAQPSRAIDVAPYPIDWKDRDRFHLFGGFVLGIASQMGIKLRWGGDWDGDTQTRNNDFDDLPHFELID